MIVLSIDTCEKNTKIELNINNQVKECVLNAQESTSENLLVKINELLENCNTCIKDVDLLCVCTGPGSFTGVRIGVSTIKGFMCALSLRAIQVNFFEKIAYNYNIKNNAIIILPSGNQELYCGVLNKNSNSCFDIKSYLSLTFDEVLKMANENNYTIYALQENQESLMPFVTDNIVYLKGGEHFFSQIAIEKYKKFKETNINDLQPLYIKQSQAERELKTLVKEKCELKRPICASDLVEIENVCFETNRWTESMFLEELGQENREYFVLYYKGKPLGYIGLLKTIDELCVLKIAIVPEFRRLGLAKKLIDKALLIKEKENIKTFYLEVESKNTNAIKFYEKMGFKTLSIRKNYYQNQDDCNVMFYEAVNK